ncbi:hypothetical protein SDC9_84727 [bioreactor metagenome]|jgi:hypothetical protein|uniref:Uncharacterized protein n=1 Tax=bioreactor metagenome TaxID=1076179 RepID=A0A644ZB33_9ZZZZ
MANIFQESNFWDNRVVNQETKERVAKLAIHGDISNKVPVKTGKGTIYFVSPEKAEKMRKEVKNTYRV